MSEQMAYQLVRANTEIGELHATISEMKGNLAVLQQAIGLATTAVPDMVVDADKPIGMMRRVVEEVDRLRTRLAAAEAENGRMRQRREGGRSVMDYQTNKEHLMGISREDAAEKLGGENSLQYFAWPQTFGSTAGPFGGIGGQAVSTFTIEAWWDGSRAVLFCGGRLLKITNHFDAARPRYEKGHP